MLKPGGYLLCFAGTRTSDLMGISLRLAGFEIRDSVAFLYGSGFPKSHNVSKAIDERLGASRDVVGRTKGAASTRTESLGPYAAEYDETVPATPEAERWEGWGTALKPAMEPILVARKPLIGTVAENVLRHGTGALNVDGCRVATSDPLGGGAETATRADQKGDEGWTRPWMEDEGQREAHAARVRENVARAEDLGRWPANVVLAHSAGCRRVGTRTEKGRLINRWTDGAHPFGGAAGGEYSTESLPEEVVEVWACEDDCPVRVLDEQTGDLGRSSGTFTPGNGAFGTGTTYGDGPGFASGGKVGFGDAGGASRFFYTAKASRAERDAGLDDFEKKPILWSSGEQNPGSFQAEGTDRSARNNHATVKPIDLMRWLVRLVTPPGGTVLDPFLGSGTTGIAAILEGFEFLGIEREAEYVPIARARLAFWEQHPTDLPVEKALESQRKRTKARTAGQDALF